MKLRNMVLMLLVMLSAVLVASCGGGQLLVEMRDAQAVSEPAPTQAASHDLLYLLTQDTAGDALQISVADAADGHVQHTLPLGVPAPDWSAMYTVTPGENTHVRAIDVATGETLRETAITGRYDWISAGVDSLPDGLSPNGRWLVLQQHGDGSRFAVLDTDFDQSPHFVELDGTFHFDAISNDGRSLYLIEDMSAERPQQYRVRLYNLAADTLKEGAIADKSGTTVMQGRYLSSVPSPDGNWLYSLYVKGERGAGVFIHALNLRDRVAICLILPKYDAGVGEERLRWTVTVHPDGTSVYAVNADLGLVAAFDTATYDLKRVQTLDIDDTTADGFVSSVSAKEIRAATSTISPDGDILYTLSDAGIVAIDTEDLTVRGHYLPNRSFTGLALSPDGTVLYATSADGEIVQLDAPTGIPYEPLDYNAPGSVQIVGMSDGPVVDTLTAHSR